MENKCEKNWFKHAWEKTNNQIWFSFQRVDVCKNCWLKRTHHSKTEEWVEYSDWKERPWEYKKPLTPC